jgi:L-rhamnose mutarotase
MQKYCLALDLKDDPKLIAEYEAYHKKIWPEIETSIKDAGITNLEIYRIGTRLFMILEARVKWMPIIQKCKNGKPSCGTINKLYRKQRQEKSGS